MQAPPDASTLPGDYAETLTRAPHHITTLLLGLIRQPARIPGGPPPGTPEYAGVQHDQAREVADRIWAEAAHAGAVWGMSRAQARMVVTAEQLEELKQWPEEGSQQ